MLYSRNAVIAVVCNDWWSFKKRQCSKFQISVKALTITFILLHNIDHCPMKLHTKFGVNISREYIDIRIFDPTCFAHFQDKKCCHDNKISDFYNFFQKTSYRSYAPWYYAASFYISGFLLFWGVFYLKTHFPENHDFAKNSMR